VAAANYISLSVYELTSIDNPSWISLYIYVKQNWKRVPIFLSLDRVTEGFGADNVKWMLLGQLKVHGGMKDTKIAQDLVCFGLDSASIFHRN
jgi:hypothetical protein